MSGTTQTRKRKSTVIAGSPEHIEIVRAPLISQLKTQGAELEALNAELDKLRKASADMEARYVDRERQLEHRAQLAEKRLSEALSTNNDLRDGLMNRELEYAKLRGYLEGQRDSAPPVMVPQQREPFHAQLDDASRPWSPGYRPSGSTPEKKWYHN